MEKTNKNNDNRKEDFPQTIQQTTTQSHNGHTQTQKKRVMLSAAKGLVGLSKGMSTSEKRPALDLPDQKPIRTIEQRAKESWDRVKNNKKLGVVLYNTRPVLWNGHLDKKMISEGDGFHNFLVENGILKFKFGTFPDKNTKGGLPTFCYESVIFYNEKALGKLYPGKKIDSMEVLENGKQNCPLSEFNKYEDIPNNFLEKIRNDLVQKLVKRDHFLGLLDDENREQKRQGESIPDKEGESADHLCCLIFFLFDSTDACHSLSLILKIWI